MDDTVIEIGPPWKPRSVPIETMEAAIKDKETTFNTYATSKSVSQISLNTASIQSQIFILVSIISSPVYNGFKVALIVFIPISILIQLLIYVLLVILAKSTTEKIGRNCTATGINAMVTTLSGILVIITSVITTLSLQSGINQSTNTNTSSIN